MPQQNIKEIIAENMRYYREKNNLAKKAVAEYLGVSASSVTHWEDGSNSIDINKLSRLCELFKCNLSDMVAPKDQPNTSLSDQEVSLLNAYRKLNSTGKNKINEYISDLSENKKYLISEENNTNAKISDDILSDLNMNMQITTK